MKMTKHEKLIGELVVSRLNYGDDWDKDFDQNIFDVSDIKELEKAVYIYATSLTNEIDQESLLSMISEETLAEIENERVETSFITRLKEECMELIEKVNKLNAFKATTTFYNLDRESKDLLYEQSRLMDRYIQILGKRMEILRVSDFIKEETND